MKFYEKPLGVEESKSLCFGAKSWELDKMSLFQSALDFLAGPGSSGAASRDQNDFVGQVVELGDMKLRIKRVIAEGKTVFYHEKCC